MPASRYINAFTRSWDSSFAFVGTQPLPREKASNMETFPPFSQELRRVSQVLQEADRTLLRIYVTAPCHGVSSDDIDLFAILRTFHRRRADLTRLASRMERGLAHYTHLTPTPVFTVMS